MELGAQEITELVVQANDLGVKIDLPTTKAGVKKRADSQNWATRVVKGKGGRGGLKTLYTLPTEIIDDLKNKGLLHLIHSEIPQPTVLASVRSAGSSASVPPSMQPAVQGYSAWASEQDRSSVIPIRYYHHVYASAGVGTIAWDTSCDVMWFRSSFIQYLNKSPAELFCTRIKGDSMYPTLIDAGTALWHTCTQYRGEGIYLFRQFDEIRVKRLVRLNRHSYHVISDNSNKSIYPTEILDLSEYETHEFELYGKYLWDCGISDNNISDPVTIP